MEFIGPRLIKSRTQKRQKRLNRNRRRNQRKKLEVKSSKRRTVTRDNYVNVTNSNDYYCTMSANAFWENYKVAHDWQHRHNVAWWKSRCTALEDENCALRQKIRELTASSTCKTTKTKSYSTENHVDHCIEDEGSEAAKSTSEEVLNIESTSEDVDSRNETLEFHVDEDMMKFLEQSIRHKMELKRIRESESVDLTDCDESEVRFKNRQAIADSRIENSKLLYGVASSRILALEAALQASIDYHKDHAKPHYWPNIPLKP